VGHSEVSEWRTGGISHRDLTTRSPETWALEFANPRSPKSRRGNVTLKSQLVSISEFWHIGTRELENQVFGIASSEAAIELKSR
jgi:hypothetical protein